MIARVESAIFILYFNDALLNLCQSTLQSDGFTLVALPENYNSTLV